MTVYHGAVKDNVVVLDAGVQLTDGMEVEVHIKAPPSDTRDKELLRARGLLRDQARPRDEMADERDRRPIAVRGTPVSELIIEERR